MESSLIPIERPSEDIMGISLMVPQLAVKRIEPMRERCAG